MASSSAAAAHQGVQGLPAGAGAGLLLQGGRGGTVLAFENACLDLFLLDLDAPPQQLRGLLAAAWDQDDLTALRLVCHRRGVPRHAEESDREREGFLTAALWMLQTHPRTLAANLAAFAEFGYIQDFPELLHRLVVANQTPPAPAGRKRSRDDDDAPAPAPAATSPVQAGADEAAAATIKNDDDVPFGYQILYDAIVDFFVGRLLSDLDHLRNGDLSRIGLAARWCSSLGRLDSALDQTLLLHKDIVRNLLPNDCTGAPGHHLLRLLRTNVVVPLINARDREKQAQASSSHQSRSCTGAHSASRASKLPHQIVGGFFKETWVNKSDTEKNRITEEWCSMVEGLRARGCLRNCIAVCDMTTGGLTVGDDDLSRLQVCVALGLLIPELSDEPWRHWVHVFGRKTASIPITRFGSYTDKVAAIREKQCDEKFDLAKVFRWVLLVASEEKVQPTGMVKNIIVLTGRDLEQASVAPTQIMRPEDMHHEAFDPRDVRRWRDEYRILKDIFAQHGFAEYVPGVVFWNLRGEPRSAALTWSKDGIVSLNGYSDHLMRLFLEKNGVVEPDDEMYAAISGEEYQKLKTVDD